MAEAKKQVVDVQVVRMGEKLIIPERLSLVDAALAIKRQMEYEEEMVAIQETVDAFPWDGALAMQKAMAEKYGWATAEPTPGWFGPNPPTLMSVETGYKQTTNIVWGRFSAPTFEKNEYLETGVTRKNGRLVFQIQGEVRRKREDQIKQIAVRTRQIVEEESIYRGQAVRIRFNDDDGRQIPIPTPAFLDLSNVREGELVYSEAVMRAINTNLFTPIERSDEARKYGIPLKRGVLLAGPYGTGKTLAAYVTAKKAQENGFTFIYLERVDELPEAIRFAQQYQPAVIFSEDIDRVVKGERTVEMDAVLNTIDGIDSKNSEIMVVLTTNYVEEIYQGLLRPGRLDAVIEVSPPDADAAARLVQLYGRGLVRVDEDLSLVGEALAGQIPAVIREVVERSKLAVISRIRPGEEFEVTAADLLNAAETMAMQLKLLAGKPQDNRSDFEKLGDLLGRHIGGAIATAARRGVDLGRLAPPDVDLTNHVSVVE